MLRTTLEIVNLHIYPSVFKFESRILKETHSIIRLGLASRVIIVSSGERTQLAEENISDKIKVVRVKPSIPSVPFAKLNKAIFYLEFYIRTTIFSLCVRANVINCHSLMMLPVAVLVKRIQRSKLIYDPHELETERIGLRGVFQKLSKWVEKKLIYQTDAIIVVSESIRDWYRNTYQLNNVFTIKNIPQKTHPIKSNILKEKLKISTDHQVFLYQGLISEGRGIELYLNVFSKLNNHQHLVIIGYGPMEPIVREFAMKFPNVHFHPALPPDQILYYTCSADVGLSVIENLCLSYYYCLPNKFFEYIAAGVPLIVSDFPDMSRPVKQYNIGWTVSVNEESLTKLIKNITQADLNKKKSCLEKVRDSFAWEYEEPILSSVFDQIYKTA
ncbi:MAG: glycosyltransferase [Cyclobacteriaceae bacterium]